MPKCQICEKECEKVYPSKMEIWVYGKLRELKADLCRECVRFWVNEDFSDLGVYSKTYPNEAIDD
jgi:hypothetical protein